MAEHVRTLIKGGTVVNEGRRYRATVVINGDTIERIMPLSGNDMRDAGSGEAGRETSVIDATGCLVLPGIIDSHVHFREPGMTHKATIASESRAAVAGGVTTFFDMPNTTPPTTSLEALAEKHATARRDSRANFSFYIGATNDNAEEIARVDPTRVPAVKLFMGSSTGNMLVDSEEALDRLFATANLPIMAHCEDSLLINSNLQRIKKELHTDDPSVELHPQIRSREACIQSTRTAISMAKRHGARLHVAHVSTAEELDMFGNDPNITAEAVVGHLLFSDEDYRSRGTLIKCNPAIKAASDRAALRKALADGRISTVATDHAPHLLAEKEGGAVRAASGMPSVQFSLVAMLSLVDAGVLSIERLVELMCHNPSLLFSVRKRGFLRQGYKADIAIVEPCEPQPLRRSDVLNLCGWSPFEGMEFAWRVRTTIINGHVAYNKGHVDDEFRGETVMFR